MMLDPLVATQPAAPPPRREQMAFTLAYHIMLVQLGVVFPFITVVMEGIGLRRDDPVALKLARRWSVVMAVEFPVGAATGTVLSFEFDVKVWIGTRSATLSTTPSGWTAACFPCRQGRPPLAEAWVGRCGLTPVLGGQAAARSPRTPAGPLSQVHRLESDGASVLS
jgi:hypothetical protein